MLPKPGMLIFELGPAKATMFNMFRFNRPDFALCPLKEGSLRVVGAVKNPGYEYAP